MQQGSPVQGNPLIPVAIAIFFFQPPDFFLSRGNTEEDICGHVNRNIQLP